MHNQSMRILFVLPLWQFWRTDVFLGTVMCQGGNNAFWMVVWNNCVLPSPALNHVPGAFPTAVGLWLCHLVPGVSHDRPKTFVSYRAAVPAALGELHQACGAGSGNFTLSIGFYQGIVQQS